MGLMLDPSKMTDLDLIYMERKFAWLTNARADQMKPPGHWWYIWLMQAGRGAGKTRTSAETLWQWAWENPGTRWLAAAPTYKDFGLTMFEGESGLIACIPPELIRNYNKSTYTITLENDSLIQGISAEEPEAFRGPQFHGGWLDELGRWTRAEAAWDMINFGMRLGTRPRIIVSTTPRPIPLVKQLVNRARGPKNPDGDVVVSRATTHDNKKNLSPTFLEQLRQYEGTRLGRQEIYGELLDPAEQGVIKRSWWRMWPRDRELPSFELIVLSLDTAFTEHARDDKGDPDPTACSVWGLFRYKDEKTRDWRDGILLLDCWQDHLGFPDLIARVRTEMNAVYGKQDAPAIKPAFGKATSLGGRTPDICIIEDKGSGISLRQVLARERIFAFPYNPGRASKLERLHAVSHIFEHRMVFFLESSDPARLGEPVIFAEPLLDQVCTYSGKGTTEHDDYVDSTSQAIRYIIDKMRLTLVDPRTEEPVDLEEDVEEERRNPYG